MIRKSKNNENKPDFDVMFNEVQEEIQERDAEDEVINRTPELRKLSENIDKATNIWVNATLQLESAIHEYQRAEVKLDNAVNTISDKVETIKKHIDQVMEDAPTKLKVSVDVSDADWEKIQSMFNKQRQWVIDQTQKNVQTVNAMLVEERKRAMSRYKEYDGCYLGHYAQWFFWFFFVLGFFIFVAVIIIMKGRWLNWF
jgi:hypothetical protein